MGRSYHRSSPGGDAEPAMARRIIRPVGFNLNKKYSFFHANATKFEPKWSQSGLITVAARKTSSTSVMRRTTSSRRRSLPRRRGARSRASTSKNSRGNARPMCVSASGTSGAWIGFLANTDAPAPTASTSPPATSAARRRLHRCCFFLGEERLKRGGVALPEVLIGDNKPAAVGECWPLGNWSVWGKKGLSGSDGRDGTKGSHRCER
jgi:hypothetical protein